MTPSKDQEATNKAEWENPNNWSSIYFSKHDTRPSVPKKNPRHGWTINFGHPKGAPWIYYLMLLFFAIGLFIGVGLGIGIMLVK